jgi:hypothetical protein
MRALSVYSGTGYFQSVFRVKISCWLICKDQLRVGNNGTGDSHALLLAS